MQNWPLGHAEQAEAPCCEVYVPAEHAFAVPLTQNEPMGQSTHVADDVAPTAKEYAPGTHCTQVDGSVAFEADE